MERIGIRELRQNASRYVARVSAGESIEVTDRGRPVARLVPIMQDGYDRMVAEGRIRPATGSILDIKPRKLPKGSKPLSQTLQEMRDEEYE